MYVNMHELANLAASRAQEMQLPLPPPPASLTAPTTDKVLQKKYLILITCEYNRHNQTHQKYDHVEKYI